MQLPERSRAATDKVVLFGIRLDAMRRGEAAERILEWAQEDGIRCRYVVTPNLQHARLLQNDEELQRAYSHASLILADGAPLLWAARYFGNPLPERVAGSDLVPELFARSSAASPLSVYLLGSAPEVGERAGALIESRFPNVKVVGAYSPPRGFEHDAGENRRILDSIREAKPHVLIVGLGAPKQEAWVHRFYEELEVRVAVCAGASIDFFVGARRRAPVWMQHFGLEWLHRLVSEPRRLMPRYARDALSLPVLVWKEHLARRPIAALPESTDGSAPRIAWVDKAKGVSILLVVVHHVLTGLRDSRLVHLSRAYASFDDVLGFARMPLFYFASGLFIERTIRRTPGRFFGEKAGYLLYPYFLWSFAQIGVQALFPRYTNSKLPFWSTVAELPWHAPMQFWFLYVLFLATSAWYALRRVGLGVAITTAGALLLYVTADWIPWGTWYWGGVRDALAFLGLGALVSRVLPSRELARGLAIGGAAGAGATLVVGSRLMPHHDPLRMFHLFTSIAGVVALSFAAIATGASWVGRMLRACGRHSLQIFVLHTMAAAAWRAVLVRSLAMRNPALHVATGVLVAVAVPMMLSELAQAVGFDWMFRWKGPSRRA